MFTIELKQKGKDKILLHNIRQIHSEYGSDGIVRKPECIAKPVPEQYIFYVGYPIRKIALIVWAKDIESLQIFDENFL